MKTIYIIIMCMAAAVLAGCGGPKLATADEQMARGEYFDASKTYRKVYNKLTKREERPLRGEVAYKMAECHRKLSQNARASAAYQNALRYGQTDSLIHLHLAQSLHAEGKYAAAIKEYEAFLASGSKSAALNELAEEGLSGARTAAEKRPGSRYVVRTFKPANSRRADYAPMYLDRSLDQLYFTTTNEKATGTRKSEITGMKNGDIWVMRKNERGEWQRPEAVEGELNSEYDEGIVSFSPDGTTMYLTKARRSPNSNTGVEIYTSQRSDASWSAPVRCTAPFW